MERASDGSTTVHTLATGEHTAVGIQAKITDTSSNSVPFKNYADKGQDLVQGSQKSPLSRGQLHSTTNGNKISHTEQTNDSRLNFSSDHDTMMKTSPTTKDPHQLKTSQTNPSNERGISTNTVNSESDEQVSSTSSAGVPPALVNVKTVGTIQDTQGRMEAAKKVESKAANSDSELLTMVVDTDVQEEEGAGVRGGVSSRSDREDSPELVIDTQPGGSDEENPVISKNHFQRGADDSESKQSSERNESRESSLEIYMDVPLEESDDDDEPNKETHGNHLDRSSAVNATNQMSDARSTTPHLKYVSRSSTTHNEASNQKHSYTGASSTAKGNGDTPSNYPVNETGRSVSPSYRVRQVAKLKQFFTTLQGFGNKLGREGAEQVQELIAALVNETASIEEFHQEIQTVTNHPLKQFIIPFLRENLGYLRDELKESSKALSDILNQDSEAPSQNSFTLTPQLADDELPVYKTPQSSVSSKSSIGTISSRRLQPPQSATSGSDWKNGSRAPRPIQVTSQLASHGHGTISSSQQHQSKQFGMGTGSVSRTSAGSVVVTRSPTVAGTRMSPAEMGITDDHGRSGSGIRKRNRALSTERTPLGLSHEKDTQTVNSVKQYNMSHVPKRPRSDISSFPDDVVITSGTRHTSHPPPYPHPPHTYPIPTSTSSNVESSHVVGRGRDPTLSEDWNHVDMMLTSMQGMMERTRQAVSLLKERITLTQAELERREMDSESIIKQRVHDAVDKVKQRGEEEKQLLLTETRKQMREAAATVRSEIETRVKATQATTIQDAVKEANKQSNSKENCWNCGRRATETCSGCNKARYCGTFCQHKDWSNHMHHCASGLQVQQNNMEAVYERRRQPTAHPPNDVAGMAPGRGTPLSRGVGVPVNLVQGSGEMNLRHIASGHIPHSHTDIAVTVKAEKT